MIVFKNCTVEFDMENHTIRIIDNDSGKVLLSNNRTEKVEDIEKIIKEKKVI